MPTDIVRDPQFEPCGRRLQATAGADGALSPTILIAAHQGFAARYFLRTEILSTLRNRGARVVILTPNADEAYFRQEFSSDDVFIETFGYQTNDTYRLKSRLQLFLEFVRLFVLGGKGDLTAIFKRQARERAKATRWRDRLRWHAARLAAIPLRKSRLLRRALQRLETALFTPDTHRAIFERYRPDVVVVPGLGYWPHDCLLMREARRHQAQLATVVLSWDNTSSKGMGGAAPDYVVTWTEAMKNEVTMYHDIAADRVFIGGVAHFDAHFQDRMPRDKAAVYSMLQLDPSRRTILLALGSPSLWSEENLIALRTVARAVHENRFDTPSQLLVRVHPIYLARVLKKTDARQIEQIWAAVDGFSPVLVDVPQTHSHKVTFDLPAVDHVRLRGMLQVADVFVSFYSTMMLEASIFDVPIVNVGLDRYNDRLQARGYQYEDYPHVKRVVSTGGTQTARTPDELIEKVRRYLNNRSADAKGRAAIRDQECGPNPGMAGAAIADILLRNLPVRSQRTRHLELV